MFNRYKNEECFDERRVHNDFSVQGHEFLNFISTLITSRIINKLEEHDVLNGIIYGDLMEDLNAVWRRADAPPEVIPDLDDGYWEVGIKSSFEALIKLGLCTNKQALKSLEKQKLAELLKRQQKRHHKRLRLSPNQIERPRKSLQALKYVIIYTA